MLEEAPIASDMAARVSAKRFMGVLLWRCFWVALVNEEEASLSDLKLF